MSAASIRYEFEGTLNGTASRFLLDVGRYVHAPNVTSLTLLAPVLDEDNNPTAELEILDILTVNPPATPLFLLDPDTDIVISHNTADSDFGNEMLGLLVTGGIIEDAPYTQVRTGMAINPVFAMTDTFRDWVLAQREKNADTAAATA
mgnify:FL=1